MSWFLGLLNTLSAKLILDGLFFFLYICWTSNRTFFCNYILFNFLKQLIYWNLWFSFSFFWRSLLWMSFARMRLFLNCSWFFLIFCWFLYTLLRFLLIFSFCLFFRFFYGIRSSPNRIHFFHWFLFLLFVCNLIYFYEIVAYNLLIWDLKRCVLRNLNFDIVENMILRRIRNYLFLRNIQNLFS